MQPTNAIRPKFNPSIRRTALQSTRINSTEKVPKTVIVKRNRTTTTTLQQLIDVPDTTTPRFGNNKSKVVIRRKFGINRSSSVARLIDEENSATQILVKKPDQVARPTFVKNNKLQQAITDDDFQQEFTALPQTFTTTNKYFYAPREQENFDQYQDEIIFTPTTRRNGMKTPKSVVNQQKNVSTTKYPRTEIVRRVPEPFERILLTTTKKSATRTLQPVLDYDYYEDYQSRIGSKSNAQVKVIIHGPGIIECLDQGNFVHPLSCRKFISCAKMDSAGGNGVLGWEYTCPKKLSFDPVGGICNWAAGLGCKDQE